MKPDRRIRSVHPSDAAALLAIYRPIVRESAISFEIDPPTEDEFAARIESVTATDPWLVMERNGEIVGYAYASPFRSRPAYATTRETTVYTHPDHQREGVARDLMTALLDEMVKRGARVAIAVIARPNEPSVRLHEALGFTRVGTIHNVAWKLETWHDEEFWELGLGSGEPHPTNRPRS